MYFTCKYLLPVHILNKKLPISTIPKYVHVTCDHQNLSSYLI